MIILRKKGLQERSTILVSRDTREFLSLYFKFHIDKLGILNFDKYLRNPINTAGVNVQVNSF